MYHYKQYIAISAEIRPSRMISQILFKNLKKHQKESTMILVENMDEEDKLEGK